MAGRTLAGRRADPCVAPALVSLFIAALLAGCAGNSGRGEPGTAAIPDSYPSADSSWSRDPVRLTIVDTAMKMVGVPYRYGGESPAGFDCSGLVHYAYRAAGVTVPRTSQEQLSHSQAVPLVKAAPGDLLFFQSKDNSHVAIYLGQGRFVHAPASNKSVAVGTMNDAYFRRNFVRAGRMPQLAG